jgi:hypothetical protein
VQITKIERNVHFEFTKNCDEHGHTRIALTSGVKDLQLLREVGDLSDGIWLNSAPFGYTRLSAFSQDS